MTNPIDKRLKRLLTSMNETQRRLDSTKLEIWKLILTVDYSKSLDKEGLIKKLENILWELPFIPYKVCREHLVIPLLRRIKFKWRRLLYLLRWKIYYKVERLWIRPKLCVVCGERMGVYYYGSHKFPIEGQGEYVKVKGRGWSNTVKWVGKEQKISHWECGMCFDRINRGEIMSPDKTKCGIGIAGV